jgi:hypothetical protein
VAWIRAIKWKNKSPPADRSSTKNKSVADSKAKWQRCKKGDGGTSVMTRSST